MTIFVVRHAKAGERSKWDGDDRQRPLSKDGRQQAIQLAQRLANENIVRLVTSPHLRCRQTLEPLAELVELPIEVDERLAENQDFTGALELLESCPDGAVLCSHGDVIPALIDSLTRRNMRIVGEPEWSKASTWLIDRISDMYFSASSWPPPEKWDL